MAPRDWKRSVVFLVDTTTSPADTQRLQLIHLPQGNARRMRPASWSGPAGRPTIPPRSRRRARRMLDETEDEYRRLLYVAMTRAADRLIVGGCMPGNMNTVREFSWYDLIDKGLAQFRIAAAGVRDRRRQGEALLAA